MSKGQIEVKTRAPMEVLMERMANLMLEVDAYQQGMKQLTATITERDARIAELEAELAKATGQPAKPASVVPIMPGSPKLAPAD